MLRGRHRGSRSLKVGRSLTLPFFTTPQSCGAGEGHEGLHEEHEAQVLPLYSYLPLANQGAAVLVLSPEARQGGAEERGGGDLKVLLRERFSINSSFSGHPRSRWERDHPLISPRARAR